MPSIDILLEGSGVGTDVGRIAFCSVLLIEGEKRILFDSAHVGRRTHLQDQLQARGLTPADIDLQVLSHAHWTTSKTVMSSTTHRCWSTATSAATRSTRIAMTGPPHSGPAPSSKRCN